MQITIATIQKAPEQKTYSWEEMSSSKEGIFQEEGFDCAAIDYRLIVLNGVVFFYSSNFGSFSVATPKYWESARFTKVEGEEITIKVK